MKRLFKFLVLRPHELFLATKTFILLGLIRLGLWLLPFAVLQKLLANLSQKTAFLSQNPRPSINNLIWAVNVSSKYMPGNVKCLARALTTEVLMNRSGYTPELRIGIAQSKTGKLEAHAWIESQGKVLIGQLEDLARFQILPLPPKKEVGK